MSSAVASPSSCGCGRRSTRASSSRSSTSASPTAPICRPALAARRLRPRRARPRDHWRRRARREAARGDSASHRRTRPDARARLLRLDRACGVHGRALHRGGSRRRSPSRVRRPRPSAQRRCAGSKSASFARCSPSTCSARASTSHSVDTVLLLRPTDSATVFTQQLGRGLRRADHKPYLTVIDLIGQQHRQFRFDRRLVALGRPTARSARRADRGRVPVPTVGLSRRARPSERGDRASRTCATPHG